MRVNRRAFLAGSAGLLTLAACGTNSDTDATVLNISAIPDQDQEKLNRLYDAVADRCDRMSILGGESTGRLLSIGGEHRVN